MSQSLSITNAFVMPGVSVSDSRWSLLVGLVADDRHIGWGECVFVSAEGGTGSGAGGGVDEGIRILQEVIIPALMGQRLSNLGALMDGLDEMAYEVVVERPITAETAPQRRSRRELFASLISPEEVIREVVVRPLPPALRFGVSQALLAVAAAAQRVSVVGLAASLYGLSPAAKPLPVHLVFDELPNTADPALVRVSAVSYGLTVDDGDPLRELGSSGIRFQNRVRQLKNRAARYAEGDVGFLFDLQGGYGVLYEGNPGSILGALNGLEQTVKGFGLRVVDPVILADRQSQLDSMKELKAFVRFRKMGVRLLARAWVETVEDVDRFAEYDACDGVLLDMGEVGTLNRTIELGMAARARGLEVVLMGVNGSTAVQAALALNPTLLGVGVEEVGGVVDEMRRRVAWGDW